MSGGIELSMSTTIVASDEQISCEPALAKLAGEMVALGITRVR